MTDHVDTKSEPPHGSSPTDHVLTELQLYGYRPYSDEPDPRPLPEGKTIAAAVADILDALVATLSDTTMLAIGLILNILGIGVFCWLVFELTVYALPFLIGFSIARAALYSGAGIIGTLLTGIAAGALTITIGQLAFAARPLILSKLIGAAFVGPRHWRVTT